jgi:hypothetical protein
VWKDSPSCTHICGDTHKKGQQLSCFEEREEKETERRERKVNGEKELRRKDEYVISEQ